VLNEYKGNVGFCSLAGKYRTGKSFLLNKLLGLRGKGVRFK
jgi:GTPase Era involved in 16S rRNA processing